MMRAIVVDDEKLSLIKMERILSELPEITYVAGYQSPAQALAHQRQDAPDIAFLDVEMPEMDGLTLANRLMENNAGMEVVFVTAHDRYALAAYQQNAIGYLLKPVQAEEVLSQVSRLLRYRTAAAKPATKIYFKVFGTFYGQPAQNAVDILKFRTEKSEELLAYLISQEGKLVSRDTICDMLWPDMEPKKAMRNFHTTAYNIRHTFHVYGIDDALLRVHDSYRLNPVCIHSDLDVFYAAVRPENIEDNLLRLEQAAAAYDGPYLANKDYIWLTGFQSLYEQAFERISLALCRSYVQGNAYEKAQALISKLLKFCPFSEAGCRMQLEIFREAGKQKEAHAFHKAFCKGYLREMGVPPSVQSDINEH